MLKISRADRWKVGGVRDAQIAAECPSLHDEVWGRRDEDVN